MAAVKCPICGQTFSREKVEYVHLGNRYYHLSCCSNEFLYTEKIINFTKQLWGTVSRPKIVKQINNFVKNNNYTYKEIYNDLLYFFDVKKSDTTSYQGTIGIVPFIHSEAQRYYSQLAKKEQTKEKIIQQLSINEDTERVLYVAKQPNREKKKFELEIEEG